MTKKPLAPSATELMEQTAVTETAPLSAEMIRAGSKAGMVLVFTYGTLKSGHKLHSWMSSEMYVGTAIVDEASMIDAGAYPIMVMPGVGKVMGELYLVGQSLFDALRAMEERVGYRTATIKATVTDSPVQALVGGEYACRSFIFPTHAGTAYWENVSTNPDTYVGQVTSI